MKIIRASRPETGFLIVRNETVRDQRLSYRAVGVLVDILSRPDDWSTSAERMIRENGKEKRDALLSAFAELRQAGYMRTVKSRGEKGQWTTATYVYDAPETDQPGLDDPISGPTRGNDVSPLVTPETDQPGLGEPTLLRRTEDEEPEELIPREPDPTVEKFTAGLLLDQSFEAFWAEYPRTRRPAKKAVRAKYLTAVKHGAKPDAILAGLRAYLALWKRKYGTSEEFIPLAMTWVSQERWNDEIDTAPAHRPIEDAYGLTENRPHREPTWELA